MHSSYNQGIIWNPKKYHILWMFWSTIYHLMILRQNSHTISIVLDFTEWSLDSLQISLSLRDPHSPYSLFWNVNLLSLFFWSWFSHPFKFFNTKSSNVIFLKVAQFGYQEFSKSLHLVFPTFGGIQYVLKRFFFLDGSLSFSNLLILLNMLYCFHLSEFFSSDHKFS